MWRHCVTTIEKKQHRFNERRPQSMATSGQESHLCKRPEHHSNHSSVKHLFIMRMKNSVEVIVTKHIIVFREECRNLGTQIVTTKQ